MISTRGLLVTKNGRTICSVPDLRIAPGERVAVIGLNGSGKTTMLRVLAGLELVYDGKCVINASMRERIYVHQSPFLFRGTILSNITYGLRTRHMKLAKTQGLAEEWIQRCGLRGREKESVVHLSGGERQRVALARAMILQPQLLLLDEPLSQMDQLGSSFLETSLSYLKDTTVIIASPHPLASVVSAREIHLDVDS